MADDTTRSFREVELELARVGGEITGLKADVRGTTGRGGLKHDVGNLFEITRSHGARMAAVEQRIEAAVDTMGRASDKLQSLATDAAVRAGVEAAEHRRAKVWLSPLLVGVTLAAFGLLMTWLGRPRAEDVKAAQIEALTDALKSLRVTPPGGTP